MANCTNFGTIGKRLVKAVALVPDSLVDFITICLSHPQQPTRPFFLVSDGEDVSTTELLRRMAQAAGAPARLLPVPVWALWGRSNMLSARHQERALAAE